MSDYTEWYNTVRIAFFLLLVLFIAQAVIAQEVVLEDVPQKELESLPIKDDGIIQDSWDWFVELLGYDVVDREVVRRSILEQDLDIMDVRLIRMNVTNEQLVPYDYQVLVTPSQTYDVPPKTSCYEQGNEFVCECTLRCDGLPGIEYGCEYTKVSKIPNYDGTISTIRIVPLPTRYFISRKEVIMSPDKIFDDELTLHIDKGVVDSIKDVLVVKEVVIE